MWSREARTRWWEKGVAVSCVSFLRLLRMYSLFAVLICLPNSLSKRLVAQNRQYDFLDDLVQQIVDPTAGIGGGGGMAGAGAGQSMAAGGSKQAVGSKIGGGGGVASSLAPPAKEEEEEEEDDDEEEY